jgi:hypothetical protein
MYGRRQFVVFSCRVWGFVAVAPAGRGPRAAEGEFFLLSLLLRLRQLGVPRRPDDCAPHMTD